MTNISLRIEEGFISSQGVFPLFKVSSEVCMCYTHTYKISNKQNKVDNCRETLVSLCSPLSPFFQLSTSLFKNKNEQSELTDFIWGDYVQNSSNKLFNMISKKVSHSIDVCFKCSLKVQQLVELLKKEKSKSKKDATMEG